MDIHKYNTRVRQGMSDAYVECSKELNKLRKELNDICVKLEEGRNTIPYSQWIDLSKEKDYLTRKIEKLKTEQDTWDKAREICLNIADEMCDKDKFKSDIAYLKGTIWYAGDSIFVESKNYDTGEIEEKTLVEILKENIKENSKVHIIINAEDK